MRFDEVEFLEISHVHQAHLDAMAFGLPNEDPGVIDERLIESAVMAPRNGYPISLAQIATMYVNGIAQNHGYQNGNKRTAVFAMALFLEMNGYPVDPPWQKWVGLLVGLTTGLCSIAQLRYEIIQLMGGTDVPIT